MFHAHLDYFQKIPLLEVGSTQNQETMALRTFTTVGLLCFIMSEDLHEITSRNSSRDRSHTTSNYTRGPVTTLHDFGGTVARPLDIFFWALTISRSRLLAHVLSGPTQVQCLGRTGI